MFLEMSCNRKVLQQLPTGNQYQHTLKYISPAHFGSSNQHRTPFVIPDEGVLHGPETSHFFAVKILDTILWCAGNINASMLPIVLCKLSALTTCDHFNTYPGKVHCCHQTFLAAIAVVHACRKEATKRRLQEISSNKVKLRMKKMEKEISYFKNWKLFIMQCAISNYHFK